jgi:hypothetical protein
MKKTKGQLLFEDFLAKLGKSLKTGIWDDLVAGWDARKKLEQYLNPERDKRGRFIQPKKEKSKHD